MTSGHKGLAKTTEGSQQDFVADESPPNAGSSNSTSRGPSAPRGEVRGRILSIARTHFLERSYDATTISAIARDANCTPAMINYYFGSKQRLFRECFNLPVDPAKMILSVLKQGRKDAGERVVRKALSLYEDDLTADTMRALAQALFTDSATSQRFRVYVTGEVMGQVAKELGMTTEIAQEIEFAFATMFGVATMRYIVCLEPMASMPRERLVKELAPIIQHRIDRMYARKLLNTKKRLKR